jgi:Mg2+ and Co2+ transporter CorA
MFVKKGIIVGLGAIVLAGGFYGINSVYADQNQPATAANTVTNAGKAATRPLGGKRLQVLSQYTSQIHQVNKLREERLDLKKQLIQKKDQLLDLLVAAKNSGNKDEFKQAKDVKKQLKSLNGEMQTLLKDGNDERKALKDALKNNNGQGSDQFNKLISTDQQINEKLKSKLDELTKLIDIFNNKDGSNL